MIGAFINISLVFLFIRYFFIETWGNYGGNNIISYVGFVIYTAILINMQFSYSLGVIKNKCDYPYKQIDQFKLFTYILFPNLIIFMLMFAILKIFPGWKAPFSNTFGYLLASTMGISSTFTKLLTDVDKNDNPEFKAALSQVTGNKSLMINQFTVENFAQTFQTFVDNKLFNVQNYNLTGTSVPDFKNAVNDSNSKEEITDLFKAVSAKDLVSEHIWYILSGCLVITIVKNTMGELNCNLINRGN